MITDFYNGHLSYVLLSVFDTFTGHPLLDIYIYIDILIYISIFVIFQDIISA